MALQQTLQRTLIALALLIPTISLAGVDQPWNEPNDGSGDPTVLGYLFLAGLIPPVVSKLFAVGPWKDDSWVAVGVSGVLNVFVLVMAIQVALVALVVIPIYLAFKIFRK